MAKEKKVIKVEEKKKKKDKIDLEDIKDFVEEHGDDIGKVVTAVGTYMEAKKQTSKKKTTSKKTTKKKKEEDDTLTKAIDVITDMVNKK